MVNRNDSRFSPVPKTTPAFDGGPSFSLSNRALRFLWSLTWLLLASWTPGFFRGWRRFLLCLFGAKLHSTSDVRGSAKVWFPANLEMGPYSSLGPGVVCYCQDKIKLGSYVVVSQRSHLCSGTHDIYHPDFLLRTSPIEISDHAWICSEAFVGPGVSVGEGAVLAARGVAFNDLAGWSVYAGNPAVFSKERPKFQR